MSHRISIRAEEDLKSIYHYTHREFGETQAEKYILELNAVFELIGEQPRIGRPYRGRTHQFIHGKHIILYRLENATVVIGRIFHGAQRR